MSHWLVQHAIRHVWCNPEQDRQYIFKPACLSPAVGARVRYPVHKQWIALPSIVDKYHLYQIGYCPDEIIDLLHKDGDGWTTLKEAINTGTTYLEVYTGDGRQLPKHSVYYRWTETDNLILAIQVVTAMNDCYTDDLYFRVYQNAYFSSDRNNSSTPLHTNALICKHPGDMLSFQQEYERWSAEPGLTTAYINGQWSPTLNLTVMTLGSCVEYVYDSSVYETIAFRLGDISSFDSSLDSQRKYLLHTPKMSHPYIRYHDDIDFYIVDDSSSHAKKGVYYHRNQASSVRMLTHQDYSLSVNNVQYFVRTMQQRYGVSGVRLEDLVIRMHVRHSGYARPLVYETNRIHELYRLSDSDILTALLGSDGGVENWRASHLEQSGYAAIMQSLAPQITPDLVESAYGYRALSQLIGRTPIVLDMSSTFGTAELPLGLHYGSTIYEYDADGLYLGAYLHDSGWSYTANNHTARFIEGIYGVGSYQPFTSYGKDQAVLPSSGHYRVYLGNRTSAGWGGPWSDITDSDDYYVADGKAIWQGSTPNQLLCIRSDQSFLMYDLAFVPIDGTLRFPLSAMEDRGDGLKNHTLLVPYGNIDLFLNGKSLIQGLDYTIDFPEIVIINKAYLTTDPNTTEQQIHIRCTGFTTRDVQVAEPADIGFVMHGALSYNRRYDLRDDAVQRIVVDGKVKLPEQVRFAEELTTRDPLSVSNGKPYVIEEVIVPMEPISDHDTYQLHEHALNVDTAISQYMSVKYPQPDLGLAAIPERYAIVSPFLCKLIFQLYSEELPTVELSGEMTDLEVIEICRRYLDWLKFDPIRLPNPPDSRFVEIHPLNIDRTIALNLYQYRFIHQVVRIYCPNKVDLAPFITLDPHRSLP